MEQLPKIAVSIEAEKYLEDIRKTVNEGFSSGRVAKGQLASWIIANFWASLTSKAVEKIRADHFDEIAHLEAVVKQLKEARESNASVPVQELLTPIMQRQRVAQSTPPVRKKLKEDIEPME